MDKQKKQTNRSDNKCRLCSSDSFSVVYNGEIRDGGVGAKTVLTIAEDIGCRTSDTPKNTFSK